MFLWGFLITSNHDIEMILYWFLFIVILIFSLRDWKKTVIVWMPLQLLFNECVCLKYTPPAVSFVLAVDALLFLEYLVLAPKKNLYNGQFFFKTVFVAYLISYGVSMVFSIVPFSEVLTGTIKYFIQNFIIVYLFQKALNDEKDIKTFFNVSFVVVVVIIILGLYESVIKDNPVLDYVYANAPAELIKGKMYYVPPYESVLGELQMRYGMVRVYSFFDIHIAFGCACVLLLYMYLYFYKRNCAYLNNKKILYGAILLFIGVLLSNSKTPMVGLLFFLFAFFSFSQIFNAKTILVACVLVVVIFIYAPNYLNNITALFDSSVAEEGGGSNVAMRTRQFEVAFSLFAQNPLFGNGVGAIGVFMQNVSNSDLLGAESSWLKILPERGLLGVVVYLVLYWQIYFRLNKLAGKRETLLLLCGLMAMETATGFMDFALYGSVIICIYRYNVLMRKQLLSKV